MSFAHICCKIKTYTAAISLETGKCMEDGPLREAWEAASTLWEADSTLWEANSTLWEADSTQREANSTLILEIHIRLLGP